MHFVKAEDLEKYTDEEKVYNSDGTLTKYEKGTFIYRLAGRDREKSASYYTPEVLTKCLVKYALKELLKDKNADDILKLTVCEPAMGSAAFLNEAINQLAEAYLEIKQRELGERIAHDEYAYERQKVKMYLADNNVFGVDLNPVAVELAEISLWLNTISKQNFVPWFGMQLVCGNSLIGARRQVFRKTLLKKEKKTDSLWLGEVPERVMPNEKRNANTVFHFLLPDKGMADYKDKVIKQLAGDNIKKINDWRKNFINEFSKNEIKTLQKLSDTIDKLWSKHTEQQRDMRKRTTDAFAVWGQEQSSEGSDSTGTRWKDMVLEQELLSRKVRNSSPYRRLKLAMDYWCSLWFWPIEKADLLPSRDEYLLELGLILEGNPVDVTHGSGEQLSLFPDTMPKQMQLGLVNELGIVDVDKLCQKVERLGLVQKLSKDYRFLHWELEYADLFEKNGGFDLVLGNPPWIKVEWNEGDVLGDEEPIFSLRKLSASQITNMRGNIFNTFNVENEYIRAYQASAGSQNYFNGYQNYPELRGTQSNLYKCFLTKSWFLLNLQGHTGLLHPDGVYDDPKGGGLRNAIYQRISKHFQFVNEYKLFPEVDHHVKFSINILRSKKLKHIYFYNISNLFHPQTIDACYDDCGMSEVTGIKDDSGKWNIKGHKNRILKITGEELDLFSSLYDLEGISLLEARLPALHSIELVNVLRKFADYPKRLSSLDGSYCTTEMWHETKSQKDGIIKRDTRFPSSSGDLIVSGPHFHVGTPLNKTPRAICKQNSHYDTIDLTVIPLDYLPRTNYLPNCCKSDYEKKIPKVPWDNKKLITEFYRCFFRGRLSQYGERTLVPAIMPPLSTNIHSVFELALENNIDLVLFSGIVSSLPFDFYIKSTGSSGLYGSILAKLPFVILDSIKNFLISRVMILNCVNETYAKLWDEIYSVTWKEDRWSKSDKNLSNDFFSNLNNNWGRDSFLKTNYERRQALVELDVLVAKELNFSLDELITIYRLQFPVLQQYEKDTWYDQKGRIVFTCNKGLSGVGFSRSEWNKIKDMKSGTVEWKTIDDTQPGGPRERTIVYHAPFDRCDREKDYEVAWKEFERRFKDTEGAK